MNKNDVILNEISKELKLNDFVYKNEFTKLGKIKPIKDKEKIELYNVEEGKDSLRNIVYLFVIDGYIQKVGSTTTTMKDRIQSYNCGKKSYRKNGTCSTTNYFVLQSLLEINKEVDVYVLPTYKKTIDVDFLGETVKKEIVIPAKDYEKHILFQLKEEGRMPILCTQT